MSSWTHAICTHCWFKRTKEKPVRFLHEEDPRVCCYCRQLTLAGIYVRKEPNTLPCNGVHNA